MDTDDSCKVERDRETACRGRGAGQRNKNTNSAAVSSNMQNHPTREVNTARCGRDSQDQTDS